jgi:hypothetical protein
MVVISSRLQDVLGRLQGKFAGKTEDAYRDRDAADLNGNQAAQTYAEGEAHAYGEAAESVREAQDDAAG